MWDSGNIQVSSHSLKLLLLFYASVMNTHMDIFMKTIYTRRYMYMYLLILTDSPNFFLLPCLDLVCCATSFSYSSQASACSSIASLFASKANLPYKQGCTRPHCIYFRESIPMTLWVIWFCTSKSLDKNKDRKLRQVHITELKFMI